MTISGTITGSTATFTMTMPIGSMMTGITCMATATGTFDMDAMYAQLHGSYTGVNSCLGAFTGGQLSMMHR